MHCVLLWHHCSIHTLNCPGCCGGGKKIAYDAEPDFILKGCFDRNYYKKKVSEAALLS